tara:strand:- start:149 stop:295 length:147 start_codon:yes stop_codon:yes gene_type:complete
MIMLLNLLASKIITMATKELKRQIALKEAIIGEFKKIQPQAISFLKDN